VARRLDEAEALLLRCARQVVNNDEILSNLGVLYGAKNQMELAIDYYEAAMKINANNVIALNNLGNIMNDVGQNSKALEFFIRALNVGGESSYIHNNIYQYLKYEILIIIFYTT